MTQIIHNPRCRKSREALQLIQENKIEPEIILYLKEPLSKQAIKDVLNKLGLKPIEVIRKKEKAFIPFKGKEMTDDEWINILVDNPILIERPIIINNDKAVIGRPPENLLDII